MLAPRVRPAGPRRAQARLGEGLERRSPGYVARGHREPRAAGASSVEGPSSVKRRRSLAILLAVAGAAARAVVVPLGLDWIARRLLDAPRRRPEEGALAGALERLGGEVVRLRSRDGLRLSARWLPAVTPAGEGARPTVAEVDDGGPGDRDPTLGGWEPEPDEAIVVLHGWSGSVAPDLVEYGPFLRRTAGVLGLDFRGHGDSDPAPTTFGLREIEDVAGALGWLAERGVRRVCFFGTSMGGMAAIASAVVFGDGRLLGAASAAGPRAFRRSVAELGVADPGVVGSAAIGPAAIESAAIGSGAARTAATGPRICGIVAESVPPELRVVVARRLSLPGASFLAGRIVAAASGRLGADLRSVEPRRVVGLLGDCPLFLIAGTADRTLPIAAARRLAEAAPAGTVWWEVEGADHAGAHRLVPGEYEARVTTFLRRAFRAARTGESGGVRPTSS